MEEADIGWAGLNEAAASARELAFGAFTTDCVGCRYYGGIAHPGELVLLVREPRNQYDANAIRVNNLRGEQVGHVNRGAAAALAPLLDERQLGVRVEASAPYAARSVFTLTLALSVYGPPEAAARVHAALGGRLQRGAGAGGSGGAAAASAVVKRLAAPTPESSQKQLDDLLTQLEAKPLGGAAQFDAAREAAALRTPLFAHQTEGVAWMLRRERDPDGCLAGGLPPFWQRSGATWMNTVTNSSTPTPPTPVRGGALFDDMGLGKSLSVLAVICANAAPPAPSRRTSAVGAAADAEPDEADAVLADGLEEKTVKQLKAIATSLRLPVSGSKAALVEKIRGSRAARADAAAAGPSAPAAAERRATLIVCPVTVVASWEEQIAAHLSPGALRVHVYLGAGRNPDPLFLASCDVVLTSFNTLASESSAAEGASGAKRARPSGLLAVSWRRAVLDEAHSIRNRATRAARACFALDAAHRWVLTGTPLQNGAEDVFSLLAFLRAAPLADWSIFSRCCARPIRDGDEAGLARLRLLLRTLSLRRTKAALALSLPPKTVEVHTARLDEHSRSAYAALFDSARLAMGAALQAGGDAALLTAYRSVLECIMRLRQAANAAALVPPARLAAARALLASRGAGGAAGAAPIPPTEVAKLFAALAGALGEAEAEAEAASGASDCCICLEELSEESARLLRACRHALCDGCLGRLVAGGGAKCPLCRAPFGQADVLSRSALEAAAAASEPSAPPTAAGIPPKAQALLEALAAMAASDGEEKAAVFSQFTSFLNVLQPLLSAAGFAAARLDGSLSGEQRKAALAAFRTPNGQGGPRVLLISTRAGGAGLNLTTASRVFLMDAWWNASVDEQAMNRCHRLGQTRPVRVVRYVAAGTIEEKIMALQRAKAALGSGVLRRLSAEEARASRVADLRSLFEL